MAQPQEANEWDPDELGLSHIERGPELVAPTHAVHIDRQSADAARSAVLDELEHGQLSAVRYTTHYAKRVLQPRTLAVLWFLRVYVIVMLLIVAVQIWLALHGGS